MAVIVSPWLPRRPSVVPSEVLSVFYGARWQRMDDADAVNNWARFANWRVFHTNDLEEWVRVFVSIRMLALFFPFFLFFKFVLLCVLLCQYTFLWLMVLMSWFPYFGYFFVYLR